MARPPNLSPPPLAASLCTVGRARARARSRSRDRPTAGPPPTYQEPSPSAFRVYARGAFSREGEGRRASARSSASRVLGAFRVCARAPRLPRAERQGLTGFGAAPSLRERAARARPADRQGSACVDAGGGRDARSVWVGLTARRSAASSAAAAAAAAASGLGPGWAGQSITLLPKSHLRVQRSSSARTPVAPNYATP